MRTYPVCPRPDLGLVPLSWAAFWSRRDLQLLQCRSCPGGCPSLWTTFPIGAGLEEHHTLRTPAVAIRRAMQTTALNALGADA
jgi:hypothetical protein